MFFKRKPRHLIVTGFSFVILFLFFDSFFSLLKAGATRSCLSGYGSFGCHKKLKILDTFGIARAMVCRDDNQITGQADEKPNICSTSMAVGSTNILIFIGLKFI